jgi:hypothetical protein
MFFNDIDENTQSQSYKVCMEHNKSEQHGNTHNAAIQSSLNAGNDIHIGDKHIHQNITLGTTKPPKTAQSKGIIALILLLLCAVVGYYLVQTYQHPKEKHQQVTDATLKDTSSFKPVSRAGSNEVKPSVKSQEQKLLAKGIVTDGESDAPIEGVLVAAVGLEGSTITNKLGEFTLKVNTMPISNEYRLRFSKEGYEPFVETHYEIPKTIEKRLFPKIKTAEQ